MASPYRPILRALKWGSLATLAFVGGLAILAAIHGLLFGWHPSATIYGQAAPGFEAAITKAFFVTIFAAVPLSPIAFVAGVIASFFRRSSGKPPGFDEGSLSPRDP
ncbi:MAG: hypothetical protein U0835_00440 [Isosphaeraceae bacterium]